MKKTLLLLILSVLTAIFLVSCQNDAQPVQESEKTVNINAEQTEQQAEHYNTINVIINGETAYSAKYGNTAETTPLELLKKLCADNDIEVRHLDGYVNSVAGYTNAMDKGWIFFFNGKMPTDVGASDLKITKGYDNTVDFKYMMYSEAFPED